MDMEKRLLLAQLTHAYVNEYLAAPGVEFTATRKHAHSLEQKALKIGITRKDFTKCRNIARKVAYKENPAMATKKKATSFKNPRAHIPPIRGRGRPAKKRRKTTLEWTDKKGHKHKLEFKGHSVESMKQLATSMVASGETREVIVDY